jgi:hypothetical protein
MEFGGDKEQESPQVEKNQPEDEKPQCQPGRIVKRREKTSPPAFILPLQETSCADHPFVVFGDALPAEKTPAPYASGRCFTLGMVETTHIDYTAHGSFSS